MSDRFFKCLPFTLAQEAPFPTDWKNPKNFSNDKHDPGGATYMGIIQREYDQYRKQQGWSTQPVINISQSEGESIYLYTYWLPHCPLLPAGCDLVFFDSSVNQGCTEAIQILQVAMGLKNDGLWGNETDKAVATLSNPTSFIKGFSARRQDVYQMLKGFKYFGGDWTRRTSEIRDQALRMAAENATGS